MEQVQKMRIMDNVSYLLVDLGLVKDLYRIKFFVISLFFYCKHQSSHFKNKHRKIRKRKNSRIPGREAEMEGRSGNLREQRASSPRLPSFASLISNLYVKKESYALANKEKVILLCLMFLINKTFERRD